MNRPKMVFVLFIFCMLLSSCENASVSPNPEPSGEPFTEGHIKVQMSLPGNPMFEIMQQIDYSAGNVEEQFEEIAANLTPEEREELQEFQESLEQDDPIGAAAYMLNLLFLPFQGTDIYVKENQATAKFDAITYHGENRIDMDEKGGLFYMESQANPDKRITYTYAADAVYEDYVRVHLSEEFYDIEETGETDVIAGYLCSKSTYTLKDPGNNIAKVSKLEVWTSEYMPVSLNFMHPYYLDEEGGIMKITAYPTSSGKYPIVYEFVEVTPRQVSDQEIAIQQSEPIYDYEEDAETIGMEILAIMFGGNMSNQGKTPATQSF